MKYELRPLSLAEHAEWNERVLSCRQATLFHSTTWLAAGGIPFEILGVFDGERLVGGFAAQFEAGNGPRRGARSALTPYSGQVVFNRAGRRSADITIAKAVAAEAANYLQGAYARLNVRLSPYVGDVQPYIWAGFGAAVRYTYLVDVSCVEEAWRGLDENHRRTINKAERIGLTTRVETSIRDCASVFRATREQPGAWEERLVHYESALNAHGLCRTFGTYDENGSLLAAVFLVWDRFRSYYLLGGYQEGSGAPAAARMASTCGLWRAMRFTGEELGLAEFDLEGSMIPGVELFFRKFGGRLTPFYTVSWRRRRPGLAGRIERALNRFTNN